MTDLKPCPFCGDKATAHTWEDTSGEQLFAGAYCVGCGASCETAVFADEDPASALAGMIAAWNRRYTPDALSKIKKLGCE